ncbi:MAG TPA: response regulator [Candidatus Kapabacteria bacterium]|nr:response regulator [Candidatus Kapabacteria bacterium]
MSKPTILIVDDELQIRRFLRIGLEANEYNVVEASTGKDAVLQAGMVHPDVVILDLSLPDMTGIQVLKQIREWSNVPVIILSVLDREQDKIEALDNGADDYVTKPFSMGELFARLRAALRHIQPLQESSEFRNGQMMVDFGRRIVKVNDTEVKLTATEYSLLMLFIKHAGKVLTHRQILREVWGIHAVEHTQYLRVYMAQLRKKLEADPLHPKIFITESGVGYRMVLLEE